MREEPVVPPSGVGAMASHKADAGLKLHCLTAFHGSVVAYYAIVDYHMALANFGLAQTDHPVTKMFLGGNTQFYTTWNQVIHQIYFLLSLIQDILTYSSKEEHVKFCTWFDNVKRNTFVPVVLPSTMMTMINFWTIYWIAPHLMLADLMEIYPLWLCHAVHTFITPIVFAELLLTHHGMPSFKKGFVNASILMSSYAGWMYPVSYITGYWPYPFLEVLNLPQHFVFFPLMYAHGYFWYFVYRAVEQYLYGPYIEERVRDRVKQE